MGGKVTLVGAGPGDPGLLTLKGRRAIEEAEVVVYDRLVSPAILALIPRNAKAIDVGKEAAHHKVPQEEINRILLDEALQGRNVVRLKGGDPFVFGRGGEELELLAEQGVPFEEIPGITSAIAAPAYAGIPVTHRDYCSSVHIITGHQRSGKPLTIDFEALVRTKGTLVFLMGVSAMPAIVEGLLAAGMDGDTPAAMVESGTTPAQRRCDATLRTLPERAAEMGIHSPAIIVVGKVCGLSGKFGWFEKLPLKGQRVLVTRPKDRAGTLSEKLRALGADVWEYPCIETKAIRPCPAMTGALERLGDYEWLVFTSPAGVAAFRGELRRMGKDGRYLAGVKLAAIGTGTARALHEMGLMADYIPEVYDAAHLGAGLPAGGKVLILRAEIGSPALTEAFKERTIAYDDIPVYKTVYENPRSEELRAALEAGEVPFVTFTSASTVKGLVSSVGADADFSRFTALCIGEQTAAEARRHGMTVQIAREATIDAVVELAREAAATHWFFIRMCIDMELINRPRRLRRTDAVRRMCRETRLSPDSLIYPIFVDETLSGKRPIESLSGQYHFGLDSVTKAVEECIRHGVTHCILFGLPAHKDAVGSSAWDENGVVQKAIRAIKAAYPDFYVITDVCMCEYTDHGHCGILDGCEVDNDKTLEVLSKTALSHVEAGADMVAPSDMMDGRIAAIRETLDRHGYTMTPIMSYSAKYASAFYGPFRAAAGSAPSFGDRKGYQMDPHNGREALKECALDVEEGADILMVKPALPYLDVLRTCSDAFELPMCAYQVSGEYAMIKAAAAAGLVDEYRIMCESAVSIFRAGANMLITYYAKELADAIRKGDIG